MSERVPGARWKARRGFVPSETTIKYDIFGTPDSRKPKPPPSDDHIKADEARDVLLQSIATKREILRRHYRTDLFDFCREVLGYDKMEREVHGELCQRLMDAYWGRGTFRMDENSVRRYLFLLPRGTFKTTIATICYPIWLFIQNDPLPFGEEEGDSWEPPASFNKRRGHDQRVLLGSEVEMNVARFHQNIKEQLQSNDTLRELYGNLAPDKRVEGLWTKQQSNISWRLDFRHKEANLTITSLEATVNSGHFDVGIFDDMISEKQVTNEDQIQQTIEWYRRLLPLMEKPSVVIFIGTRWHDKDLYGHFLDEEPEKWEFYREAAERTQDEQAAGKRRFFFPQLLSEGVLEDLKTSMRPYLFSCQYYNDPIAATNALFKREYFEKSYYTLPAGEHLERFLDGKTIFTTIDPAITKDKRGCFAVVVTVGWDHKGQGWVLDLFREQGVHPGHLLDVAFEHHERWNPLSMGIEQDGFQKMYKFEADRRSQQTGIWPNWIELKPGGRKKELRIAGLEPLFRAGRIFLRNDQGHTVIEEEAIRFPRGRYKDGLDALAYQLDLAFAGRKPMAIEPKPESKEYADAMYAEIHQKRLARLHIGTYRGADEADWYNM